MTLSSAEIKRQILISAGSSEIKRKMDKNPPGISEGEQIEMGNDLDAVTKMRGWTLIESYMLRQMNLVGLALSGDKENPDQKGIARALIELMQWISLVIRRRDDIIEKERVKYEAKSIPQDKAE